MRLTVLRMSKYSSTPLGFFMELPLSELLEWTKTMNDEAKRKNDEMEKARQKITPIRGRSHLYV